MPTRLLSVPARGRTSPRSTSADRTGDRGGVAEEGEDIEIVELGFDEALDMIDDGRIADAKTVMLLYWAALRGPFAQGAVDRS